MIIAHTHDGSLEIVVYKNDHIVIVFNQGGSCVARFTIKPELFTDQLTDIVLPPPSIEKGL